MACFTEVVGGYNDFKNQCISIYSIKILLNLYMDTMTINIINPKAIKLIKDLADMDLISIQDKTENRFDEVLKQLRSKNEEAPSLEEITAEVEAERTRRYVI